MYNQIFTISTKHALKYDQVNHNDIQNWSARKTSFIVVQPLPTSTL